MERKSLLLLMVLLLVCSSVSAQRMSRKKELAVLKKAYKEAIMRTERLSGELSAQVAAMDSLVDAASRADELLKENARLKMELDSCKEQLMELDAADMSKAGGVPVALIFEVGKTSIGAKELVNLTFFIENSLNVNPDKIFIVYSTENDLAHKRLDYICNLLHKKYGIALERIVNGGVIDNYRYSDINLNRVVIIQ
jgi:hypothetical protein